MLPQIQGDHRLGMPMQTERKERGLQAAETPARWDRSQPIRTGAPAHRLVSLKKQYGKFARPVPDARFCGLKAALRLPSLNSTGLAGTMQ